MGTSSLFSKAVLLFIYVLCLTTLKANRIGTAVDIATDITDITVSKCPSGTFKRDLYCVKKCGAGFYGNTVSGKCLRCYKGCKTCLDGPQSDRCSSCYSPYFLKGNKCTDCRDMYKQEPPLRKIRLKTKGDHLQGLVEVLRDSKWGTICDDGWDINDAQVVCRELMLGDALAAITMGGMGIGSEDQPIWLTNVGCTGNESRIDACAHPTWGKHSCGHFEDAGVICSGPDSTRRCVADCGPGYYKIDNSDKCGVCDTECLTCDKTSSSCLSCDGTTFLQGDKCVTDCIEGYFGNAKTRTCEKCHVSCRTCSGNANTCTGCPDEVFLSDTTCVPKCSVTEVAQQRFIRLTGEKRNSPFEGRVEVYRNGDWSTVCDQTWDFREASVVCRQLNMGRAIKATSAAFFGQGSGRIWYDKLQCNGTEKSIFDCAFQKVVWNSQCYHVKDAGVVCSGPQQGNPLTNMCVKQCPDGFFKDANDICKPCRKGTCATCIGSEYNCLSCSPPKFFKKDKTCVDKCGTGMYGHIPTRKCQSCDKKCVTCADGNDGMNCTSCSAPLTLKDGKCTDSCKPDLFQYQGKCVKQCPIGFYSYSFNSTCLRCPKDCFTCSYEASKAAATCILCKPPLVSLNRACTSNCTSAGKVSFPVMNVTGSDTVRLVNGSDHLEGLLLIYHNGEWGTICDDGWDYPEAMVVCRQLNLGTHSSKPLAYIKRGTGRIWLDDMHCIGSESALEKCGHRTWGDTNCNHNEDVVVRCSGPGVRRCQDQCPDGYFDSKGECKLCDGSCATCVGNATNCLKCSKGFYKNGSTCVTDCGVGYFLDSSKLECKKCNKTCATCFGNMNNCTSCMKPYYRRNSECSLGCGSMHKPAPTYGIRLAGSGKDSLEGRVEILHNGIWGTVCDDGWDIRDAIVACRMLNLGNATAAVTTARFGAGTGQTWLDDLECTGNENSLGKCNHRGWGQENCEHSEDAGVRCAGPDHSRDCLESCGEGYYQMNGSICGKCSPECKTCDFFANNCTTCEPYEFLNRSSVQNSCVQYCGDGFYAENLTRECKPCHDNCMSCLVTATNCTSCRMSKFLDTETNKCIDSCNNSTLISGVEDIRLAGTNQSLYGRLEVKYNGQWGTVCDDSFDDKDADVACRQLKLGKQQFVKRSAFYGPGVGKVILDDLQCTGTERSLFDCKMHPSGIGSANCGHSEDVGIGCTGPDTSKRCIRTCPKGFFKQQNVCHKCSRNCLGCFNSETNCTECQAPLFLEGSKCVRKCTLGWYGNTMTRNCLPCNKNCQTCLDGVSDSLCKTCEPALVLNDTKCTKDCGSLSSVGILLPPRPKTPTVRLVGGKNKQEGRVEVFHEGVWGTICDDDWGVQEANVICRELGFGKALKAPHHAFFGKGKGIVWMDNVDCYGYESTISQCRHHGWGINNCDSNHAEDASVICDNSTIEDVSNNYCREVVPGNCSAGSNPCFNEVSCVNLGLLTNSGKEESICLRCPDQYIGDGRVCRVVSSTKPKLASTMPTNQTYTAGNVASISCSAAKGTTTPAFFPLTQDWAKDGKPLDPSDVLSKRILTNSGQLLIHNTKREDTGNYSCSLKNTAGTTTSYTYINIIVIPEILASPPVLGEKGGTARLTCVVTSFPAANITWKRNGREVSVGGRYDTEDYSLIIKGVVAQDSGDYECHVTNELGSAMSKVLLTVGVPTNIVNEPSDQSSTKGESKTLKCVASGEPKPEITWKKDGVIVVPDENHVISDTSLKIKRVGEADIGYYACIAKNPQKIQTSFASIILIGRPIIDIAPINMSVLSGANVTFYCQVLGSPKPTISWIKHGQVIKIQSGNTRLDDTLTLINVQPKDAGKITCRAYSEEGTDTRHAYLTVDGETGIIRVAVKKSTEKKSPLSRGAIAAIVIILLLIVLIIIGVVVYRYWSARRGRDGGSVRYELGSDSGKPSRLTALKYKLRTSSKGVPQPMGVYDDNRPFADDL